jgi:hypothetical protein
MRRRDARAYLGWIWRRLGGQTLCPGGEGERRRREIEAFACVSYFPPLLLCSCLLTLAVLLALVRFF